MAKPDDMTVEEILSELNRICDPMTFKFTKESDFTGLTIFDGDSKPIDTCFLFSRRGLELFLHVARYARDFAFVETGVWP